MRRQKDGEISKPPGDVPAEGAGPTAEAKAFDPKDFNLELDKVKGGYGYGGYGGGYGGGWGGGYSGGWGSYASWGGGWSNW